MSRHTPTCANTHAHARIITRTQTRGHIYSRVGRQTLMCMHAHKHSRACTRTRKHRHGRALTYASASTHMHAHNRKTRRNVTRCIDATNAGYFRWNDLSLKKVQLRRNELSKTLFDELIAWHRVYSECST
ncbi:unnamed protein product [Ixodes pacificus]